MDIEGKRILVIGLGRTGEAVCDFLLEHKARVKVTEIRNTEELNGTIQRFKEKGIEVEAGKHTIEFMLDTDMIVKSPGVPHLPQVQQAREKDIKVMSEVELAFHFLKGKIIGVTGSNGKSTTASLIHKILSDGGLPSYLAGNIGTPLIRFADNSREDHIYVTELSSFQLEDIQYLHAPVSIILNITPDHLDWHDSFDAYYSAKKNLLLNQNENDMAILNRDDPLVWSVQKKTGAQVFGFSRKKRPVPGCYLNKGWIVVAHPDEVKLLKPSEIPLHGIHNQENVMASAIVGITHGLSPSQIAQSIQSFKGLEHRLEKVATIKGIDFFNDSKATNVDATLKSVTSFDQKIILILGGRDKGGNFKKLKKSLKKHVRKAILIGEAREKIADSLRRSISWETAASLKEAVRNGYDAAQPGNVVLLAPACTSFDMFQNFEERGDIFKKEVRELEKEIG